MEAWNMDYSVMRSDTFGPPTHLLRTWGCIMAIRIFRVHRASRIGLRPIPESFRFLGKGRNCGCDVYGAIATDPHGTRLDVEWCLLVAALCYAGDIEVLHGVSCFSRRTGLSVVIDKGTIRIYAPPIGNDGNSHRCNVYITLFVAPQRVDARSVRRGRSMGGPCRGKLSAESKRLSDLRG